MQTHDEHRRKIVKNLLLAGFALQLVPACKTEVEESPPTKPNTQDKIGDDEEKETLIQALTYLYEYNWQAAVTTSESSLDSILHVEIQLMIDFHSCPDILRLINRNSHSERVF